MLPPTRSLDLRKDAAGRPLKTEYRRAFEYSDCRVAHARLVVLNARDAADRGAVIATRTRLVAGRRHDGLCRRAPGDRRTGGRFEIAARAPVNAAGPWVADVIESVAGLDGPIPTRLVKGSHIVVERLFDHDRAYVFQN